jgi:hypothetical protein
MCACGHPNNVGKPEQSINAEERRDPSAALVSLEVAMRYALMIEPQQGCSYEDQLAIARRAEAAGFETLFRSDHYDSFPGEVGRPTSDAWTDMPIGRYADIGIRPLPAGWAGQSCPSGPASGLPEWSTASSGR